MGFFDLFGKSEKHSARKEERQRMKDLSRAEEIARAFETTPWPVPPKMNPVNVAGNEKKKTQDPVTETRKAEIGPMIFQPHIQAEPLKFLPLEELLFLNDAHEKFHKIKPLDDYEENHRILRGELLNRIRSAESLFLLNDLSTGYPFIDHGYVNLYLDKQKAEEAVQAFAAQYRNLSVKRFLGETPDADHKRMNLFDFLYYLGMEHILVNNGGYRAQIVRSEIAAPPNVKGDKRVVASPALCFAMCDFLGEARWNVKYDKRAEILQAKEEKMMRLIRKGTYIVPIQHEGPAEVVGDNRLRFNSDTKVRFFILQDKNDKTFLPLFTDINEYVKNYKLTQEWEGAAFSYDQIKGMLDKRDGIVINPFGENVMVLRDTILYEEPQDV